MTAASRVLAGALVLAVCQCGSAPALRRVETIRSGDTVIVSYRGGPTTLTLRNASSLSPELAYSAKDGDPNLKVTQDSAMQALLDSLATLGFYERAAPVASPGAKATLTVVHGGRQRVLSRLPVARSSAEEVQRFLDCFTVFRAVYDRTTAYHTGVNVSHDQLYEANRRLLEDARRRLERSRRGWEPR